MHSRSVRLCGRVFSGSGEGAKYVELYREVFREHLGIDPYPGTLNVDFGFDVREILSVDRAIVLPPPRPSYASLFAYASLLNGSERVFAIKPQITRYTWRVLEVVSEHNLRIKFGLRDGDFVELIFTA